MSPTRKPIQVFIVYLLILTLALLLIQPESAFAQARDGIKRQVDPATGKVNFISSVNGRPLAASQVLGFAPDHAADPALAIAQRFGSEFGLQNAAHELTAIRSNHATSGRVTVHYQQQYQGIPVMGGELIVNTNDQGDFYSMNGEVAPDLSLPTQPTIDSEQASRIALQAAAKWYRKTAADFIASTPTLWVFDEGLLKPSQRPSELVWRMEVTPVDPFVPVRELVLVNAQRGSISLHFNQIDVGAKNIGTFESTSSEHAVNTTGLTADASAGPLATSPTGGYRKTYTANHGETLPGQFLCDQTKAVCTNGNNPDADKAHKYAAETWNFYHDHHGRNSIDNQGMTIISTVQYSTDYLNAFWSGTQMVYGDNMVADDIVGHELTHGVTQYESNLFYYYQSGAINESFSDVWGELLDQSNTSGNDAPGVKWQIGEDSPVGAFRSMSDPTLFGDPDSITNDNYDTDPLFQDNGGVHHNSGVNNKAAYLMVDGGTFGGKTITALSANKTLAVYYEAQTNLLTSGADYADLYGALYQACLNLVGGVNGITNANCQEVRDATDAVSMNAQPTSDPNFNTDAPFCASNMTPQTLFSDDMESGTTKWTFGATAGGNRWQLDSSAYGPYAHSGLHSLYAYDLPATVTDTFARLKTAISIPAGAYLRFSQAFGFEDYFYLGTFDGGVLEYSTNGGTSWVDAGPLFVNNGYNGTVDSGYDNPLGGRSAFVGDSHGYISSRVDLSSLANKNVIFRWRMGLDTDGNDFGWWLDDVQIYTCGSNPGTATKTPTRTATSTPTSTHVPTSTPTFTPTACVSCANVQSWIGGGQVGAYTLGASQSGVDTYALSNGPVEVKSTNSVPIIAAERVIFAVNNTSTSYSELMGLPKTQLATSYLFPWYNNQQLDSQLRFGNVGTSSTVVSIKIHGVTQATPYTLAPGESTTATFPVSDGPAEVFSDGQNIIAAERVIFAVNGTSTSYSELMGLPKTQATTSYLFPWYNNLQLNSQLRFGNVGSASTIVSIKIHGVTQATTYTLAAGESTVATFPVVSDGPVEVFSDGQNIIAAERVIFSVNNTATSYSELMGLPQTQLATSYLFPWYNNQQLDSQLRFGNVGSASTIVSVKIHGVTQATTYALAPGESTTATFPVSDGPVEVFSDGQKIIAAERVIFAVNGTSTSYSELMGLPKTQAATSYLFPWYNNQQLDSQLRFAMP